MIGRICVVLLLLASVSNTISFRSLSLRHSLRLKSTNLALLTENLVSINDNLQSLTSASVSDNLSSYTLLTSYTSVSQSTVILVVSLTFLIAGVFYNEQLAIANRLIEIENQKVAKRQAELQAQALAKEFVQSVSNSKVQESFIAPVVAKIDSKVPATVEKIDKVSEKIESKIDATSNVIESQIKTVISAPTAPITQEVVPVVSSVTPSNVDAAKSVARAQQIISKAKENSAVKARETIPAVAVVNEVVKPVIVTENTEKITLPGRIKKLFTGSGQSSFKREDIAKLGMNVLLSYGFVSNVSYVTCLISAWIVHGKATGLSPLVPGQLKSFFAAYLGLWIANNFLRPLRFSLSLLLSPLFENLIGFIQRKSKTNRALATALTVLLVNVFGTLSFLFGGLFIATKVAKVPFLP